LRHPTEVRFNVKFETRIAGAVDFDFHSNGQLW
jgi:hypothetical protein